MIYADQPGRPGGTRKKLRIIVPLLILLFLAALGVFTLLIRERRAPRAELPGALTGATSRPTFQRTLVSGVPRPLDVALSPDGKRVYVAEGAGAYAVAIFDASGKPLTEAAPPHTTATDRQPVSIAVAPDGTLYVVDRRLGQVLAFNADGTYRDVLRPAGLGHWAPLGLAVDDSGLVFVSETVDTPQLVRHRVLVLKPDGTIVLAFGKKGDAPGDLMFPGHLAVDGKGRIWVGDITGVKVFSSAGAFLFRLKAEGTDGVSLPGGLAYRNGRLYVTDVTNHRVLAFDVRGDTPIFLGEFGTLGFGRGELRYPAGIAVSASAIYIANRENGRIDIWTP